MIAVARISTDHQDEQSLNDQENLIRTWIAENYDGPVAIKVIATRGSGERLDRKELRKLRRWIQTKSPDLVIAEDLGRIARRIQATEICELCEDHDVRLIALNDNIDTAKEDWRLNSFFASFRHEQYNKDTAKRICRSLKNRFLQGAVVQTLIFCIHKPSGCKHDSELQKIPEMVPIVEEMVRRLEEDQSYSEVADWLNEQQVPTGKWSRRKTWSGEMVGRIIHNQILKGCRIRNRTVSKRVNKTGKRKSVKASPEDMLVRNCPHLAFVTAERYDALIRQLAQKNAMFSVGRANGEDPRKGRPKKRTRWPGQHVVCGICGHPFVFGGHGKKHSLMCNGARAYRCWNGASFDSRLAAKSIAGAVHAAISGLAGFDAHYEAAVRSALERKVSTRQERQDTLEHRLAKCESQLANLVAAIRETSGSRVLLDDLRKLESEQCHLQTSIRAVQREPKMDCEIPSAGEFRQLALKSFESLALDSYDFARLMKRLIPAIAVFPVRLIDGGHIVLRARFSISLVPFVKGLEGPLADADLFGSDELVVDLFEQPQRVACRQFVVENIAAGMFQRDAAKLLGLTQPAVQNALKLDRLMRQAGVTDPYQSVLEPPSDYKRFRRHLHPRYRFEPKPPVND